MVGIGPEPTHTGEARWGTPEFEFEEAKERAPEPGPNGANAKWLPWSIELEPGKANRATTMIAPSPAHMARWFIRRGLGAFPPILDDRMFSPEFGRSSEGLTGRPLGGPHLNLSGRY